MATSTLWPTAFAAMQCDAISHQPVPVRHVSINLQSDLDSVSAWMALQPTSTTVIHPTWPVPATWEADLHDPLADNTKTNRTERYYWVLAAHLQLANPGRVVLHDRVNEMFDRIYHGIDAGVGPLSDFDQLFRDTSGHLSEDIGSCVAHNGLREAFGQPTGVDSTVPGVDPAMRPYLDSVVAAFPAPEPGAWALRLAGLASLEMRRIRLGRGKCTFSTIGGPPGSKRPPSWAAPCVLRCSSDLTADREDYRRMGVQMARVRRCR